jgi:hypothetical protein
MAGLFDLETYAPSASYLDQRQRQQASDSGFMNMALQFLQNTGGAPGGGRMNIAQSIASGLGAFGKGATDYSTDIAKFYEPYQKIKEDKQMQDYMQKNPNINEDFGLPKGMPATGDMIQSIALAKAKQKFDPMQALLASYYGGGKVGAPPAQQGFAGGTPAAQLYNPVDPLDKQQARIDAQEGGKLVQATNAAAGNAMSVKNQAKQMLDAQGKAYTGPFADINQMANQGLALFGNEDAKNRATAYQTIESGSGDMARHERQPSEGQISDFDAKQFMKIVPSPQKNPEFNQAALSARTAMAEVAREKPQFIQEYRKQNRNLVGADEAWQRYLNDNPVLNPSLQVEKPDTILNQNRKAWRDYFGSNQGMNSYDNLPEPIVNGIANSPAGKSLGTVPLPEKNFVQSPSAEDIAHTAQKYGISEQEVKQRLGLK